MPSKENDLEFKKRLDQIFNGIRDESEAEFYLKKGKGINKKTETKRDRVSMSISDIYDFTLSQARRAVDIVLRDNPQLEQCDSRMIAAGFRSRTDNVPGIVHR